MNMGIALRNLVMGKELIQKGGARFGGVNISMLGATLIVNENESS